MLVVHPYEKQEQMVSAQQKFQQQSTPAAAAADARPEGTVILANPWVNQGTMFSSELQHSRRKF